MRGASRGDPEVGQVRRPRVWFAATHSGGPGTRSGGTMTPPQGACWTGTGCQASSQETRTPGAEIAAMERRVASALRKARARRKAERPMVRRSALHSPRFRAREKRRPRSAGQGRVLECRISGKPDIRSAPRAAKNRGGESCLGANRASPARAALAV